MIIICNYSYFHFKSIKSITSLQEKVTKALLSHYLQYHALMILTLEISAMMVYSLFITALLANGVGAVLGFLLLLVLSNTRLFSGLDRRAAL